MELPLMRHTSLVVWLKPHMLGLCADTMSSLGEKYAEALAAAATAALGVHI